MMYNMNGGGGGAGLLTVAAAAGESGPTPRTPEILNSLMSMTNPFDKLRPAASSPRSESSSSPPSVQLTCSKLIKEGLKHTLQTKRRNNSTSTSGGSPLLGGRPSGGGGTSPESQHCDTSNDGLTPEDEERRRRRRERNKIAATKCRQKKRERTNNLVYESETLETQNLDLKTKIQELEDERRKLVEVLSVHRPSCKKQSFAPSPSVYTEYSRSEYSASTGSYPSVSYEVRTSESSSTSYQHHHSTTATVIEDIAYTPHAYLGVYRERLPRDPIITYAQSGINPDELLRQSHSETAGYPLMNGAGRSGYPSRLTASTSSSDYESNTELLDSPSGPGHFQLSDDHVASYSSSSTSIFPSTSCIT